MRIKKNKSVITNVVGEVFEKTLTFMAVLRGPTFIFEFANSAYLKMVGQDDIIGKPLIEVLPHLKDQIIFDLLDQVLLGLKPFISTKAMFFIKPEPCAPSEPRYLEFLYQPLFNHNNAVSGIFVEGRDVTNQQLLENALRQADRRKDEFLAIVAHELRNPLGPIRHAAQISLTAGVTACELKWSLEVIDRQAEHMGKLLDDLLDISRITNGKLQLHKECLQLNERLLAVVNTARPLIEARGHQLSVEVSMLPVYIDADPVRFNQIFSNLLSNAAKYTDCGGKIRVEATVINENVEVKIIDNGIGISQQAMPEIFEMYSQANPAVGRSEGGLGIGLSLVRGLVLMHGGEIEARSAGVGMGSEFIVHFPFASVLSTANSAHEPPDGAAVDEEFRVLVVDDNQDNANLCSMFFRRLGHEVRTAYSGTGAVKIAGEFFPHFILLDIGLPGINGYDVAKRIRATVWGAKVILVAITGYGQEDDKRQARAAGFNHHITKPFDFKQLKKLLQDEWLIIKNLALANVSKKLFGP